MPGRLLWYSMVILVLIALVLACSPGSSTTPTTTTRATTTAPSPPPSKVTTTAASPTQTSGSVSFAGKTVTIVVPVNPGGGSDTMARLYTRHLGRFLPGNPSVIVRNMAGGDHTIAANYVYAAKADGLTTLFATQGAILAYITRMTAVKYDLQKMEALFATRAGSGVYYYSKPSLVSKAEDLPKTSGIIFGSSGGAIGYIFIAVARMLDIKVNRAILAYAGAGESRRAFLAGEINVASEATDGYTVGMAPYIEKGEVSALFQSGVLSDKGELVRESTLPLNIPTGKEVYEKLNGKVPTGLAWETYRALVVSRNYANPLLLPPGVPDNVLKVYRDGTQKMLQDSAFSKEIEPLIGQGVVWLTGETLGKEFKANMTMDPKIVDWLVEELAGYGITLPR